MVRTFTSKSNNPLSKETGKGWNNLMNKLWMVFMLIPLVIVLMMISGCTQLEEMQQQQLTCAPIEANGCIGWLGDKPIMLEQDL